MTVSFALYLVGVAILCVILWLAGVWFLRWLGAGEPWPKILGLVIALIVLTSIIAPLFGGHRLWPVGP